MLRALRQIGAIHDFIAEENGTAATRTVRTITSTRDELVIVSVLHTRRKRTRH